jgi:hypothetical protein
MPVPVQDPVQVQAQVVIPPVAGQSGGRKSKNKDKTHATVTDSESLDLGHIEQERLTVSVLSSGTATAEGHVEMLTVNIMGSGTARLGDLKADHVTVNIYGGGTATVAPLEELKARIKGSGNIRLATRPARIDRVISGSGHIIDAP